MRYTLTLQSNCNWSSKLCDNFNFILYVPPLPALHPWCAGSGINCGNITGTNGFTGLAVVVGVVVGDGGGICYWHCQWFYPTCVIMYG